jgi:hypothetical protein
VTSPSRGETEPLVKEGVHDEERNDQKDGGALGFCSSCNSFIPLGSAPQGAWSDRPSRTAYRPSPILLGQLTGMALRTPPQFL